MADERTNKVERYLGILLVVYLTAIVLQQALPLFSDLSRDSGIYLYVGKQIARGNLPYIDAWEQKPPIIFYINALGLLLGSGTRWGGFFLEFIFIASAGLLSYRLVRHLWGTEAALLSTTIWLLGLGQILQGGNLTEEYSLPFSFLSLYLFWAAEKRQNLFYYLWIGICLGINFFIRPNNIGTQISIGTSLLVAWSFHGHAQNPIKKTALIGAGAIIIVIIIALYFSFKGILYPMIEVGFLYNLSYGSKLDILGSLASGSYHLSSVWWVAFAGYIGWSFYLIEKHLQEHSRPGAFEIAPLIMLPVEIVMSGLSGRNYPHYFISWLPVMAFFSGFIFHQAFQSSFRIETYRFRTIFLLIVGFLSITNFDTLISYKTAVQRLVFERSKGVELTTPIADYIRESTHPSDTVLVWSSRPGINFMANRDAPTAYFGYPLYINPKFISKYESIFFKDIITNPPELIVDSSFMDPDFIPSLDPALRKIQIRGGKGQLFYPDSINNFFEFLDTHYHMEAQVHGYVIYQLNEK